ncbi:hypothetical protein ACFFRE_07075 [Aciditerrimonas ferrireducens]|jgi:hypothetical protein|uniref:DoxX family membrane protein n=1 Tax=Aciditerrimonas ferrireducens TaxID=667306 RepID=A0ABV6C2I9_9ACTN
MGRRVSLHQLPVRLAAGVFIANSGLNKLRADEETAGRLHGMASGTYPFLKRLDPATFTRALGVTEVALGTALAVPFVPTSWGALGLAGFSGGLLGLYARTPGMREEGSWRPTHQGTALAKDVWLAGIALSLLLEQAGVRRRARRAARRGQRAEA